MSTHKTVLVSCHIIDSPQAIPLATSILKSYQPYKNEVDVILEDFYLNGSPAKAAAVILNHKPDSIGFSMYIWNRDFLVQTAEIIKKENKDIIVFAGGAEITASALSLMDNSDFDYLIRGEGEIPFTELLEYLIGKNKIRPDKLLSMSYLKDLNLIPSPFLTSDLDPSQWDGLLWELSRGCPFNCSFCCESRGVDGVRYFSDERIEKELILFEKKKVRQIFVLDPTFNIDRNRALTILSLIKKNAPYIHYTFEIRAELLDKELADKFAQLHCSLQIGLQSSHADVLKKVNRTINQELFSGKINLLNRAGAVFGLDLIYGLPGDTKSGFLKSLDYALYQIPNHIDIFRLSIFPGTELFEKAEDFKIQFEKKTPYSVISTPDYNSGDLQESQELASAVDLFYNQGRSAGWLLSVTEFLGITPSDFFERFSRFLQKTAADKGDIFELQNQFLIEIFISGKKENHLAVAIDLSLFHHLYGEALHAQSDLKPEIEEKVYNPDRVYRKNSLLKHGIFSFDPTLYFEMGMINIEDFTKNNFSEVSYGLIFNNGYEILTMAVEKTLYEFIITLDGKRTINQALKLLNIKADEIQDFIDYLIETTLIIPL